MAVHGAGCSPLIQIDPDAMCRFEYRNQVTPCAPRFDLFSRDLDPAIKHVWAAEYDVAWTGDIAGVFGTFPERPDFICSHDFKSGGTNIGSGWSNYHLRTWLQVGIDPGHGPVRPC